MALIKMQFLVCFTLLIGFPMSYGIPTGSDPAATAAEPLAAAGPGPDASIGTGPAPGPVAGAPAQPSPGGIVTEHKNPDGSTITVTRYNGPLPDSAFRSPLQNDVFRLHDAILQNNLYQTQLIQLQAQQAINQALLRNMQLFPYQNYATFASYMHPGQYLNPFMPFGFPGYPFFPYGGSGQLPASRTIK